MTAKENRKDHIDGVYTVRHPQPDAAFPLILDSPHSGRLYPADFHHACPREALERAEDNQVDLLLANAPAMGASVLQAIFPRTYIDLNRAVDDIDIEVLNAPWPNPICPSSRAYAGIGLVRRLVRPGMPVYDHRLGVAEVQSRIDQYYIPYHQRLESLIADTHYQFGGVWHINVHSMPSQVHNGVPYGTLSFQPDFVLGDRDGTSCHLAFTHFVRDTLKSMGYRVAINNPYKGVEIVRRHSHPAAGRHSLQLEINKNLYWDEKRNNPAKGMANIIETITNLTDACRDFTSANLRNLAAD